VYSEYEESLNRRGGGALRLTNVWMRLLRMSKSKRILFRVPAGTKLNIEFLVAPPSFLSHFTTLDIEEKGRVWHLLHLQGDELKVLEIFPLVKAYSTTLHIPLRMM
jgi:hypothetical protein